MTTCPSPADRLAQRESRLRGQPGLRPEPADCYDRNRSGKWAIWDDIRAAVIDGLAFDPDVDTSAITVHDRDGEVVLNGSVRSYPQYVTAAAVASRVTGVKHVPNHLQVALPPGDRHDDPTLSAMANDALTLGHTVAVGVKATAKNGDITLTGPVRGGAERAAAEAMIAHLTGVRSVTNHV
jgi:osmotically-inducible protein OsmY